MTSSGAAYPPPTRNTPIFSPNLYPEQNQPITESNANNKYVQTGTATQVVRGMKRFNDLGFTGTGALQWTQPTAGVFTNFAPNITTFNQTFILPTYTAPTLDTIVGRTAVQTLTNKTIGSFQTSSPSGTQFYVSTPPIRANQIDPHFAIYTKTVTPGASTQINILNFSDGTTFLRQIFTLHLSGGLQNLPTMFAASFTFSIFGTTPNLGVVTRTYDSGNNITLYSNSASNVLTLGVNLPNNQTGRFSYTLTVYPSSTIDGGVNATKMYTIEQI